MGDFSVPCVLSGLPIAAGQKVVAFLIRKARFEDSEFPFAPVCQPYRGVMGDYGRVDAVAAPTEPQEKGGLYAVHAHAKLYDHAAFIFKQAMPKPGSLWTEMLACQQAYTACLAKYKKLGADVPVDKLVSLCHGLHIDIPSQHKPWLAVANHILLCVSDPETFTTELMEHAWSLILGVPEGASFDQAKLQIDEIQKLLCVFAATRITGHPIRPHGYTFEQYPTFAWEHQWQQEVARLCRSFRKEDLKRQEKADE